MLESAPDKIVRGTGVRSAAAQQTRENILRAATKIFSRYGYEGGSVDKISRLANSHDRMIYYYYGNKEGLFIAVLEDMYRRMDAMEIKAAPQAAKPVEALHTLIRFKLHYYWNNPEFLALLNSENLQRGKHLSKLQRKGEYSALALRNIADILVAGVGQGLFRDDINERDVFLLIASTAYFYASNRYTLSKFLGEDLGSDSALLRWENFVTDSVLRVVRVNPGDRSTAA